MAFTESIVEDATLNWFGELGFSLPRAGNRAWRTSSGPAGCDQSERRLPGPTAPSMQPTFLRHRTRANSGHCASRPTWSLHPTDWSRFLPPEHPWDCRWEKKSCPGHGWSWAIPPEEA